MTKATKVALLLPNLGGGGAERVAVALANNLVAQGHDVDVVLVRQGGALRALLSPKVAVFEFGASRTIAALPKLISYMRRRRPDAVHAFMYPTTVLAILARSFAWSRARLVVSEHTHVSQHFAGQQQSAQFRRYRWITRLFYRRADERICCSQAAADDLSRLTGISRSQFEVVYSPISPPPQVDSSPGVDALWGEASKRIINVGSLLVVKNQALLIHAFARLQDREAKLIILGEGPLRHELEALARDLGVAARVSMPGFVLDPWSLLASADVFVLSSNHEGSPVALAEAMYVGLNIVATDCVSGPAELLNGGELGELVPCGDVQALSVAIARAFDRPRQPEALRARALELAGPRAVAAYSELTTGRHEAAHPTNATDR